MKKTPHAKKKRILNEDGKPLSLQEFIEVLGLDKEDAPVKVVQVSNPEEGEPPAALVQVPVPREKDYPTSKEPIKPPSEVQMRLNAAIDAGESYLYPGDIRKVDNNEIMDMNLLKPNGFIIEYEQKKLTPYARNLIDEMRVHNAEVAEQYGEMQRRAMLAMLEYQTQCISMMTANIMDDVREMCVVIPDELREDSDDESC